MRTKKIKKLNCKLDKTPYDLPDPETEMKIKDLLKLNEGSVVELERLAGDPLDILANGVNIARGEVVMVGERFGIRFTEVTNPENRVKKL